MNNNQIDQITLLKDDIIKNLAKALETYWNEFLDFYHVKSKDKIELLILPDDQIIHHLKDKYISDVPDIDDNFMNELQEEMKMASNLSFPVFDEVLTDDECKIINTKELLIISYDFIWIMLKGSHYDLNKFLNHMKLQMKKSLGRILFNIKTLIGLTRSEYKKFIESREIIETFCSFKETGNKLVDRLIYDEMVPGEKEANELVGITMDDIILDYKEFFGI